MATSSPPSRTYADVVKGRSGAVAPAPVSPARPRALAAVSVPAVRACLDAEKRDVPHSPKDAQLRTRWEADAWFAQLEERWQRQSATTFPWTAVAASVGAVIIYPLLLVWHYVLRCCLKAPDCTVQVLTGCDRSCALKMVKSARAVALAGLRLTVWAAACGPVWLMVWAAFDPDRKEPGNALDALGTSIDVWMSFCLALAAMVLSTTVKYGRVSRFVCAALHCHCTGTL